MKTTDAFPSLDSQTPPPFKNVAIDPQVGFESQISHWLETGDAPLVLALDSSIPNISFLKEDFFPYLETHPGTTSYTLFTPSTEEGILCSLRSAVGSIHQELNPDSFGSNDPDEWSVALRRFSGLDSTRLLVVESLDAILDATLDDQALFAIILNQISCESGISVLMTVDRKKVSQLSELPGFKYLAGIKSDRFVEIPESWSPPPLHELSTIPANNVPKSLRCKNSDLLMGSAAMVALSMVFVSLWVSQQFGNHLTISSPNLGKVSPLQRSAKVRVVDVASPKEAIAPLRNSVELDDLTALLINFEESGGDLNRANDNKFMVEPLPVALIPEAQVEGERPNEGEMADPIIPDFAHHSTEELYLKRLLTIEEFPYDSIVFHEEDEVGMPSKIEPIETLELLPTGARQHLSKQHRLAPSESKEIGSSKIGSDSESEIPTNNN